MNVKQRTIKSEIVISGLGLHTGKPVTMTLKPAPDDNGNTTRRLDLENQPGVVVDAETVSETSRARSIYEHGACVSTIEHLMAALVGLQIDNELIDTDGPEVPIMDGSSAPFVKA